MLDEARQLHPGIENGGDDFAEAVVPLRAALVVEPDVGATEVTSSYQTVGATGW